MNQDRYTVKATEALHETVRTAGARGNPEATPSHLLLALLRQEGGLAPKLLDVRQQIRQRLVRVLPLG